MKNICNFCLLFLSMLVLAACNINTAGKVDFQGYETYVIDMTNDGLVEKIERDWWSGISTTDETVEKNKTVTYDGTEYIVEYDRSQCRGFEHSSTDVYRNRDVEFYFYSEDGAFKGFHFGMFGNGDFLEPDIEESYKYAVAKAKEVATQYIDIEDYQIEEDISVHDDEDYQVTLYTFRFIKYIGNYRTTDDLYIQITSKGDVRTFDLGEIGAFDELKDMEVDVEKLEASIENKFNYIYNDAPYNIIYNKEDVVKQTMAYTPERQLVIVTQIEPYVDTGYGTGFETGIVLATEIPIE